MAIETVFEAADGVFQIHIKRPEKKNAITLDMYGAMIDALQRAAKEPSVRSILFRGCDGIFTSGNDLGDFVNGDKDGRASGGLRFLDALSVYPKPIVAAVDGLAIGIGTTMLLHCDLVYASPDARFQLPFINLGLVPEAAASLLLPLSAGRIRASELLMLGEPFDAETALAAGITTALVPLEELHPHSYAKALKLASKPASALRAIKRLILAGSSDAVAKQLELEGDAFAHFLRSPEFAEAAAAFREKRAPDFKQFD